MEYNTIPPPPLPTSSSSSSSLSTSISSSSSSISSCNSNSISTSSLSSASSSSSSSSLSIAAAAATSSKITNASTSPNSHTNLTTIATPITTINNMGNTNGNDVMANGGGGGNGGSNGNTIISNGNIHSNSAICCKCDEPIKHRYLLRALDLFWHEDCLKCDCCGCRLGEVGSTLYTKSNLILCKRDYLRIYGTSGYCAACNKTIPAFEMVMRAKTNVYHLDCFACQQCNHRFCVGDQFYLCDNKILCVYDYEERLVFASMPCNPTNLAHIRRQVSSLQPVGDSALNNCGNLDIQNGNNRNIQLPIHTREFPSMYINEKFPILIDQHQLHQLQQHQHQHPQQHLHQQVQPQPQPPQPPQQPHHPSNIGHQPRDDGSSGYGSPDSETLETSPQTQQ